MINDLRMFELETYLQSKVIEGFNGDTISRTVAARQLSSDGLRHRLGNYPLPC